MIEALSCNTRIALSLLLQNLLAAQQLETRDRLGRTAWLKEYATLKFGGPRQSGHTTAMIEVGMEMFENPIFLFMNQNRKRRAVEEWPQFRDAFLTTQEFFESERRADAIFVDTASFTRKSQIDQIYSIVNSWPIGEHFCLGLIQ